MFVALRGLESCQSGLQSHSEHTLRGQLMEPEVLLTELLNQSLPSR